MLTESDEFKESLERLIGPMRGYALALTHSRSDADDLVQEALLRAWRFRVSYKPGTNLKAWLFQILRNTHYTEIKRRRSTVQDVDGHFAAELTVDGYHDWRLEYFEVLKAIQQLTPQLREALLLIFAGDFTYEEVAAILDCPLGTAKSRVFRARRKLAEMIVDPTYSS
ncbi:sigma-70 family RNA polymerase sigma factor [Phenylobacterium sp.]|uniref:sigma-70 family RNA polymerase sigma factor n=1 Tax=Phenylobacterium sp. TaxID=1871053 RepID=UPI0027323037|nr:sigma-70 family RNA polymerase sigma factor [Phenylobacterium sp.]MDP3659337.1 sigma-70 family RNA polymerase sigma factor [Phenylobacterium sp.]